MCQLKTKTKISLFPSVAKVLSLFRIYLIFIRGERGIFTLGISYKL